MGRSPCCDKIGLKKGPWTPEEDHKLLAYIEEHGHGSWRALPSRAGLQRCGKSCRLRWTNYLRPDIKRGKFSLQEEQTIIQLHALLGNRWSAIATHLPKRTDNEIKNYWNTHLKKRLTKMGIDPLTHKPKNDASLSPTTGGQSKNSANLSHMAQWESARLEAEARLVRQSKLCGSSNQLQHQLGSTPPLCLDILKAWNGTLTKSTEAKGIGGEDSVARIDGDLESPTSTLSFLENAPPILATRMGETSTNFIGFVNNSGSCEDAIIRKEQCNEEDWEGLKNITHYKEGIGNSMSFTSGLQDMTMTTTMETGWTHQSLKPDDDDDDEHVPSGMFVEKFTELLLNNSGGDKNSFSEDGGESDKIGDGSGPTTGNSTGADGCDYYEDNKSYWNSILNLVSSSPSDSSTF